MALYLINHEGLRELELTSLQAESIMERTDLQKLSLSKEKFFVNSMKRMNIGYQDGNKILHSSFLDNLWSSQYY